MAIRVTRTMAEVGGDAPSTIRVTRTMAEVAGTIAQADLRLYRLALMVLVQFSAGTSVSAQSTVTFSDSELLSRPVDADDTVTFSETADLIVTLSPIVEQDLTFTQSAVAQPSIKPTAATSMTFTHAAVSSLLNQSASQTVTFTGTAFSVGDTSLSVANNITFSQTAVAFGPVEALDTVLFTQAAGGGKIIPGGLVRSASNTVTFSHTPKKVKINFDATDHDGEDTVTFGSKASLPKFYVVPQSFILSQLATPDYVYLVEHTVEFSYDEPVPVLVRPLSITDTVSFGHSLAYINRIDLCSYSPSIGGGTDPNAPAPPPSTITVTKQSFVTLSYPTVAPTTSVTIRAPEFGDVHRLSFDRVNRETRGGTLQIYSDPDWPKQEILVLQFTTLKEAEAQAVLTFFQDTLGQEVKLVDWYGRTWHGFVTNPESPLVRSRRGIVDLSFEFEGEQQ